MNRDSHIQKCTLRQLKDHLMIGHTIIAELRHRCLYLLQAYSVSIPSILIVFRVLRGRVATQKVPVGASRSVLYLGFSYEGTSIE